MAKDQKQDPRPMATDEFPTYPKDQLYVAVQETDGPAAGFDGGPSKGGRGVWARGDLGQWTADSAVPLAIRDPQDGRIVRGYLEAVESVGERNGKTVATRSAKLFGVYSPSGPGTPGRFVPAEPSPRAVQRATRGATPMTDALTPGTAAGRLAQHGILV